MKQVMTQANFIKTTNGTRKEEFNIRISANMGGCGYADSKRLVKLY